VNHHYLVHYTREATPRAVWTNLLMLFFVSLIPFFTEWVADSRLAPFATAMYEADFLTVCGTFILFENSVAAQLDPEDRALAATRARANRRNWFAFALYALAIPAAFWEPVVSLGILLLNGVRCIVPESRMGLMRRKALLLMDKLVRKLRAYTDRPSTSTHFNASIPRSRNRFTMRPSLLTIRNLSANSASTLSVRPR
jgi:hypothetical protein